MEDWFKPIGGSLEIPKVATKSSHSWGQLTSHKKPRRNYQKKKVVQLTGLTLTVEQRLKRRFKQLDILLAKIRVRNCSSCNQEKSRAFGIRVKREAGKYYWICGDCNKRYLKRRRKAAKILAAQA